MAGFRFGLLDTRSGSPFDCERCTRQDREARNCCNRKGLREEARAVEAYTPEVVEEHREKGARKVFRLAGLRLYECPLSYISMVTSDVIRLVYLIEGSGALLFPGGWGAQPAWLVEAYEVFRAENARDIKDRKDDADRQKS